MKELIELATIERLFQLLAIGAPVLGLFLGAIMGVSKQNLKRGAMRGFLFGLLGTANYLLWRIYNALTDANGLDSVRGLFVNFGLFTLLGIAAGIAWAKLGQPKPEPVPVPSTENL
jgi:hypothetical protein